MARAGLADSIVSPEIQVWLLSHILPGRKKYPIFAGSFDEALAVVKSEYLEWEAQAILAKNSDVRRRKALVEAVHCINVMLRWIDMMHTPPITANFLQRACTWQGKEFASLRKAAKVMGVPINTLRHRWIVSGHPRCLDGMEESRRGLNSGKRSLLLGDSKIPPERQAKLDAIPGAGTWERENLL